MTFIQVYNRHLDRGSVHRPDPEVEPLAAPGSSRSGKIKKIRAQTIDVTIAERLVTLRKIVRRELRRD